MSQSMSQSPTGDYDRAERAEGDYDRAGSPLRETTTERESGGRLR